MNTETKKKILGCLDGGRRDALGLTDFDIGQNLKEEITRVVLSKKIYVYEIGARDKKADHVFWSVYADFENNRIWVVMYDRSQNMEYYGYVKSTIEHTTMDQRGLGIATEDALVAYALADCMAEFYKDEIK